MEYNPFITAIKRGGLSRPTKELLKRNLLKGDILNYGCGFAEDNRILWEDHNIESWAYDKYNLEYKDDFLLNEYYDTVICNYVLNVIPSLADHEDVVKLLRRLGDNIYIAVRADRKAIKDSWRWSDREQGYWTRNSFQRFYCSTMIDILFGEVEYIVNNQEMKLFRLK